MQHDVNQGNVKWIAKRLNDAVGGGSFTTAEVILGLAEFTGAFLTSIAATPVSGFQALEVFVGHLRTAMRVGFSAKGFNMGEGDH